MTKKNQDLHPSLLIHFCKMKPDMPLSGEICHDCFYRIPSVPGVFSVYMIISHPWVPTFFGALFLPKEFLITRKSVNRLLNPESVPESEAAWKDLVRTTHLQPFKQTSPGPKRNRAMHPILCTQVDGLVHRACANHHRSRQQNASDNGQSEALKKCAADLEAMRDRLDEAEAEAARLGEEKAELSSTLGNLTGEKSHLAQEAEQLSVHASGLRAWRDEWLDPVAMIQVRGVQRWGLGGMQTACVMRPVLEGEQGLELVRWWRFKGSNNNSDPDSEPEPHEDGDSGLVGSARGGGGGSSDANTIMAVQRPSGVKRFAVDTILGPDVSKDLERVGDLVEPIIRAALALDGSHSVVLAYGHSGAGKTTCLESMITRAAAFIFGGTRSCGDDDDSGSDTHSGSGHHDDTDHGNGASSKTTTGLEVRMSFTQEYLDSLQDLLLEEGVSSQQGEGGTSRGEKTLRVPVASPSSPSPSNNPSSFHVHNSVVTRVSTAKELLDTYRRGTLRRTVRSTRANSQSSRSHAFLVLTMTNKNNNNNISSTTEIAAQSTTAGPRKGFATLVFMDLGGHERPGDAASDDDDDEVPASTESGGRGGGAAAPNTLAPKQKKKKKKTKKQQQQADLTRDEGVRINTALNHLGTILSPGSPLRTYFGQLSAQRQELRRGQQRPGVSEGADAKGADPGSKTKPKSKSKLSESNLNKTKAQAKAKGGVVGGGVPAVSTVSHVFRACTLTRLLGHFLGMGSGSGSGGSGSGSGSASSHSDAAAAADLVPRVLEVVLAVAPTEEAANDTVNTLSWMQV